MMLLFAAALTPGLGRGMGLKSTRQEGTSDRNAAAATGSCQRSMTEREVGEMGQEKR